jgi:hypothetical protein
MIAGDRERVGLASISTRVGAGRRDTLERIFIFVEGEGSPSSDPHASARPAGIGGKLAG